MYKGIIRNPKNTYIAYIKGTALPKSQCQCAFPIPKCNKIHFTE